MEILLGELTSGLLDLAESIPSYSASLLQRSSARRSATSALSEAPAQLLLSRVTR